MFAPRRASLCICFSNLAEEDLRHSLVEGLKQNIRQWEGHDRPRCMYCAPSSSTDENTTSSSSEGSMSNASSSHLNPPLDWLLCMRCGLVCCADHADIHHNQNIGCVCSGPINGAALRDEAISNPEAHSCFFALRTSQHPALASCRSCSSCVAGTALLPRLSDTTRRFLCDLDATHRVPLEEGHLHGLPNVLGHCSFMNAVLQCLVAMPSLHQSLMNYAGPFKESGITVQWFRAYLMGEEAHNKRALTDSLHESHRRGMALDDDDYRGGEEDCCIYWDFVLSQLERDLSQSSNPQLAGGLHSKFASTVMIVDNCGEHQAFGLHISFPSPAMGPVSAPSSSADDPPLTLQTLLPLIGVETTLESFQADAVVAILLRRFSLLPNHSTVKDCRPVTFPRYIAATSTTRRRLLSVVAHRGALSTGHHHAYVRDTAVQPHRWILYDDLRAQIVSEDLVLSEPCASILIYGPIEQTTPTKVLSGGDVPTIALAA